MSGTIHTKPLKTIRDWRKGEPLLARRLNQPLAILRGLRGGVNQPTQVPSVARGGVTAAGISVRRAFHSKVVRDDYLVCRELDADGNEAATDTNVALPWLLQRIAYDNTIRGFIRLSYLSPTRRLASIGQGASLRTETQIIIPRFILDDMVYATLESYTGVATADGEKVQWQAEYAGRAWAREHIQ